MALSIQYVGDKLVAKYILFVSKALWLSWILIFLQGLVVYTSAVISSSAFVVWGPA